MTLPLVPAISQWDGGPHEHENCSCASGARLLLYGTGIHTTPSTVRARQSDQVGGTSIPDVMRGLHNGWSFEPAWSAPNDGTPIPVNGQGQFITVVKLQALLRSEYMVIVQGDYGNLPVVYREQKTFQGDHAFTVDDWDPAHTRYYVVDTLPRPGSGYTGRWVPASALHAYAFGLSGTGRIFAAWAKPPTTHRISIHPIPPAKARHYFTYGVSGKAITARTRQRTEGLSAACTAPEGNFHTSLSITVPTTLVRVTSGVLAGDWVDGKFATKE